MNRLILTCLCSLFTLMMPLAAWAWGDNGHLVVAQIAWLHMDSHTQKKALELLMIEETPGKSGQAQFEQMAIWADALTSELTCVFSDWHFINYPIVKSPIDYIPPIQSPHLLSALEETEKAIMKYADKVSSKKKDIPLGKKNEKNEGEKNGEGETSRETAEALKMMFQMYIHLIADAHQPLHCASLFSAAYPQGDKGGNLFKINVQKKETHLHLYWDLGLGLLGEFSLSKEENKWNQSQLAHFTKQLLLESSFHDYKKDIKLFSSSYKDWIGESYEIAADKVYPPLYEQKTPSAHYILDGQKIVKKQLARAGYRLACKLNELLSAKSCSL